MKKALVLFYGILAYFIFLISFLYAIGFVGNFIVPKSIDSGTETTLLGALLVNALLLSIFAIQHTIMARPAFKSWLTRFINPAIERSTFVLLSSLALLFMYWKWQPINTIVWQAENESIILLLKGIFYIGWLIVFLSTFMINHFELFGLKQIYENLGKQKSSAITFQERFFYKIVRHPIMLGFIIAFWATPKMTVGHLTFAVITTLYIIVAVKYLEEPDLKKAIGKEYEAYQKKVPMLIPFMKSGLKK